ncbi:MAG: prepilin-type processing-associated H-X9-DG protein [Kiritimatiellia bacterium]|jgi:prepilin-type processing-associated H-X9-DG protein
MIAQTFKDLYFTITQWIVLPNTARCRLRYVGKQQLKLHLGCGDDYIAGMINVDGNIRRKKECWLDLRNRLPFADNSASLIYCSHTLEHLFPYDAIALLKEMRRVLSPDGVVRLAVPSFERCLKIMAGEDFSDWPRSFEDRHSQVLNYLFCDGQHKYGYCFDNLSKFCEEAGFSRIENYSAEHAETPKMYGDVEIGREPKGSLILELYK